MVDRPPKETVGAGHLTEQGATIVYALGLILIIIIATFGFQVLG